MPHMTYSELEEVLKEKPQAVNKSKNKNLISSVSVLTSNFSQK
jgi:hypothetical protein